MKRNGKVLLEEDCDFDVPKNLRNTPEKKLIAAVIERAVSDYLRPNSCSKKESAKIAEYRLLVEKFCRSKMSVGSYARFIGMAPRALTYRLRLGGLVKWRKDGYMTAEDYLFLDCFDDYEFSFISLLGYLFPDNPEEIREKIRKELKKSKNALETTIFAC